MLFYSRLKHQLQESAWLLGICLNGFDDLKNGHIQWIDNGKYAGKKWFADPFILDYDDQTILLLVEEFDYQIQRGRIAKLTIARSNWKVTDCQILLDLDTHLSFPLIWRQGDEIFVCPENYHSGGWNMYRYNVNSNRLEFVQQIVNEKLTDATLWSDGKSYWILSTYEPKPNGSELTIWKSDMVTGLYHEYQRVTFEENVGRNAGMMFQYKNQLIRPAQESNKTYGHSISFQKVKIEGGKFFFNEIYRFVTPHKRYDAGSHTYNQYKDMAVIDVKGYRYRWSAKVIGFVVAFLIKIGLKQQFVID